jgi:hypothetical protein
MDAFFALVHLEEKECECVSRREVQRKEKGCAQESSERRRGVSRRIYICAFVRKSVNDNHTFTTLLFIVHRKGPGRGLEKGDEVTR